LAIRINPKRSETYLERGEVYIGKGDRASGFADFDKARVRADAAEAIRRGWTVDEAK
jgi:hypothetical protein